MATVNTTLPRVEYTATAGQTVFTFPFLVLESQDMVVVQNGTVLTLTTDYTISGLGSDSGGSITLVTGATLDDSIVIYRDTVISRDPKYTTAGLFRATTVENEQIDQYLITQELDRDIDRKLGLAASSLIDPSNLALPTPEDNKAIVWDGVAGAMRNSVTTLANLETVGQTVADNIANITTVATNIANVNLVGTNISDVTTVADDIAAILVVSADLSGDDDIGTVATSIANVNTVGSNIANVNTVAGIEADVTTVAGISANVTTVAGVSANVTTVAGIAADVTTVAGISSEVVDAAANIPKANRTATVAPTVNDDSNDGYSVGSLWIDTVTDIVYFCVDATVGAAVWEDVVVVDATTTTKGIVELATDAEKSAATATDKVPTVSQLDYVLVETITASSDATVEFTDLDGDYFIDVSNVVPVTSGTTIRLQVSDDNGSTYENGASDYENLGWFQRGGSATPGGSFNSQSYIAVGAGWSLDSSSSQDNHLEIKLKNFGLTGVNKIIETMQEVERNTSVDLSKGWSSSRFVGNTNALNAVRFFMGSGNIATGTFKLYKRR